MELGNFSISLAVTDIHKSVAFYKALDFEQIGGEVEQKWCVLKNGSAIIGLYQEMFEDNMLTFNPKWDSNKQPIETMTDIREIKAKLKEQKITIEGEIDSPETAIKDAEGNILASAETTSGPAFFTVKDPDGNVLLFDQHI